MYFMNATIAYVGFEALRRLSHGHENTSTILSVQ